MKHSLLILFVLSQFFIVPFSVPTYVKAKTTSFVHELSTEPKKDPLSLSELNNKYQNTFFLYGSKTKREIALTFDDAPDNIFTPQILDILKQKGVKATFFVVGYRIKEHPDIFKRIIREGHALGNHSYNHANFSKLSNTEFRNQIIKTDNIIKQYTGYIPRMIRPPYGNINEEQLQWLKLHNKKIVNWNVDSLDWKGLDEDQVASNVLLHVKPGAIILQHSGTGTGGDLSGTVKSLPKIIDELNKEKYHLVTIPKLLNIAAK
ncbi:polysaccharide deacetylase family protein [Heyndrickxia oleronia]|uniref:polysaccharide deacetylase family protein n=1 Tax=Heyndrickxia oleronia TaxID=38875 RepID=UPI00203D9211|nr:polysaccharide deacetylase family protein [Heyndrickxia oleronia]MCM3240217.1 polysaccharide deacetylase family protein [Heyndrickxia oleronia]